MAQAGLALLAGALAHDAPVQAVAAKTFGYSLKQKWRDGEIADRTLGIADTLAVTGWPDTAAHILDTLARRGLIASAP